MENTMNAQLPKKKKDGFLSQAGLVLVLSLFFGSALAAVQMQLGPVIEDNKRKETEERIPELVPGPSSEPEGAGAPLISAGTMEVKKTGKNVYYPVYRVARGERLDGWVVKASGQGYADKIELLLGLAPSLETITGLFILDQKETPGLGNKIVEPSWRGQFSHKSTDAPLEVVKGNGDTHSIDAVTGATISSKSVTKIVNTVVADLKGQLTPDTAISEKR